MGVSDDADERERDMLVLDFLERRYGLDGVQKAQARDPRAFELTVFGLAHSIYMARQYAQDIEDWLAALRDMIAGD